VLDWTTTEALAMSLERGSEQDVLYGLSLFEVGREAGWHPTLRSLLKHPSPAVRQRVLSDAGDRKIHPQVEKMLGDESPEVRAEALHYLVVHTGCDPLTMLSAETGLPDYVVQGSVVPYLARTGEADNLAASQVVFDSMLSGSTPGAASGPESVLTRALRERMARELERIFRLLGLLYPPRDIHNAYAGLTSGQVRIRANAMEVLEYLVRGDLYKSLVCALDHDVSLKEKLQFALRLCHTSVDCKAEALRILLHSEDRWLRACALFAVGKERLKELTEELRRVPADGDPLLEETWNWANARLETA
jgi:hypothetical protein